jgi:hypothetical protein
MKSRWTPRPRTQTSPKSQKGIPSTQNLHSKSLASAGLAVLRRIAPQIGTLLVKMMTDQTQALLDAREGGLREEAFEVVHAMLNIP